MKEIQLTQGQTTIVDDADFEFLSQFKWSAIKLSKKHTWYAVTNVKTDTGRRSTRMHQMLLGKMPGMVIDHIDGDGLNNTRENLRHCTQANNIRNSRPHSSKTSRFKGVSRRGTKWVAQIQVNKRKINLGEFEQEADAAQVYNFAATEHFGVYARLNEG